MKKLLIFIAIVVIIVWLFHQDGVGQILNEDLFLERVQEEVSYELLWVTIPLLALQGIVTLFPFLTLLLVHLLVFSFWEALVFSWAGTFLGSMVCFYLGRYFFHAYFQKIWQNNYNRYRKWIRLAEEYGMWGLILLRHIPVLPSNVISLIGAFSPIRQNAYFWSSILGNLSMVWLYALFSTGVTLPEGFSYYVGGYILFAFVLAGFFVIQFKRSPPMKRTPHMRKRHPEDETIHH